MNTPLKNRLLTLSFLGSLCAPLSYGATLQEQIIEAQTLFQNKAYNASIDAWKRLESNNEVNQTTVNFGLGKNYSALNECAKAIPYYRKTLTLSPSYTPAKLELALCHYTIGEIKAANSYASDALKENLPSIVRQNIIDFLELLKRQSDNVKENKNSFFATLMGGMTYDNNVFSRTDNFPVILGVNANEKVEGGWSRTLMVNMNDIYDVGDVGEWILKSTLTGMSQHYNFEKFHSQNVGFLSLTLAPAYKFSTSELSFPLWGNKMNYGSSLPGWGKDDYMETMGMGVKLASQNTPALRTGVSLKVENKHFVRPSDADRDARSYELFFEGGYVLSEKWILDSGLTLTKERQKKGENLPDVSYDALNARMGITAIMSETLSSNISANYRQSYYKNADSGNLENATLKRQNDTATMNVSIVKKLAPHHSLISNANYTKQYSNNTTFDFNKWTVGVSYAYELYK